jgi:transcriptional regulator with XRE-family HTH domain
VEDLNIASTNSKNDQIQKTERFKKAVGKRLRTFRKSTGLNVSGFAKKIKIGLGTLSELENGISAPSAQTLANLYFYTDINIPWILTNKGNMLRG